MWKKIMKETDAKYRYLRIHILGWKEAEPFCSKSKYLALHTQKDKMSTIILKSKL